ncbi:MAG: NAD-dependent epimerase/dehydratase family protein [Metallosphaera sp.]
MRFLLLGLGFISTHVALTLSELGEDVTVTYRNLNPVKEEYIKILNNKVNLVKLDPLSSEIEKHVKGSDTVVNFIGEIKGSEDRLKLANVEVPKRLAELSFNFGKTFIHLSGATSTGTTGKNVKEEPEHCKDSLATTQFERSKCNGEKEIMRLAIEKGGDVTILRPTLVYGRYAAHIQFVTMYRLSKLRIIPELNLDMATVNAWSIGKAIHKLGKVTGRRYLYATECGSVKVSKFFEIMAESLNGGVKIPIPTIFAKLALPAEIRSLLRYSGTTYDCSKFEGYAGELKFDESEIKENVKFLKQLDREGKLVPT